MSETIEEISHSLGLSASIAPVEDATFSDAVEESTAAPEPVETEEVVPAEEKFEKRAETEDDIVVVVEKETEYEEDVKVIISGDPAPGPAPSLAISSDETLGAKPVDKVAFTKPRIYIKNLTYDTTEEELEQLFSDHHL